MRMISRPKHVLQDGFFLSGIELRVTKTELIGVGPKPHFAIGI